MAELRERKKQEARQHISDAATALFIARGFDDVTLDEVALAAGVSKMTVFNYFARKEDLMLDRDDDVRLVLFRDALRARSPGEPPGDALRRVVDALRGKRHPLGRMDRRTVRWWRVVAASPSLRARLRELADEAAAGIAHELAGPTPDGITRLAAGLIVLTVRTARDEAVAAFVRERSVTRANATFLALIERGFATVDDLLASRL